MLHVSNAHSYKHKNVQWSYFIDAIFPMQWFMNAVYMKVQEYYDKKVC